MSDDQTPITPSQPETRPTMRETLAEIRHRMQVNTKRVRRGQPPLGPDWLPVK